VPFELIKTSRLYLQVTEQILHAIVTGERPAGSQLPQERQLSEMLGVSRPTIREALAVLEVLGFIETRPGQGTFVRGPEPALRKTLDRAGPPIKEVIEARIVCEVGVAELLARGKYDLTQAVTVIDLSWTAHQQGDIDRFVDLGLSFHNVLADCTGNSVLSHILRSLTSQHDQPVFRLLNKQAMTDANHRLSQLNEHRAIVEAIQRNDFQDIRAQLTQHLEGLEALMTL